MQIPKEIAALIERGEAEVLCHGEYQPYDILPKYGARPIGDDEIIFAVKNVPGDDVQTHPQGVYRRFIFTGTPEQEDKLASLIGNAGLTHDDLVLILSTLQLNSAAFGETSIHQPDTPTA